MDLRGRTARGALINGGFLVATTGLALIQGTLVARLLPTSVIGRFELLMAAFMTVLMLGSVGVDDKYIQQDDHDQQRAFEIAFTLQWVLAGLLALLLLVGIPAFAAIYGQPSIVAPGLVLIASLPALVFQMPLWVHYRRMDFLRQRKLQLLNSATLFVAMIALVLAGLQLWALVIAGLISSWVTAAFCVRSSPYRLRLRWERGAVREYRRFSWPLLLGTINTALTWQVPIILAARMHGPTAVAGIALAISIAQYTTRVDDIVTNTLYPAICAVKDRADLLFEAFWKSNRLALLWAAPMGCLGALFIGDFVHLVIGEKWRFAAPLIGIVAATAAVNQIGFNWTAFYRAIGETQPIATLTSVNLVTTLAVAVPLLATHGVTGFGIGLAVVTLITLAVRLRYLVRLFPGLEMVSHIAHGIGPAAAATVAVLLFRVADGGARTPSRVSLEVVLFGAVALATTYVSERKLLREAINYIRKRSTPAPAPA